MNQQEFTEQVRGVIEEVRPSLQMDGGDVEFVTADLESGKVSVRLLGACHGCPSAVYTLKLGIERLLQERVPEVREVLDASWDSF